MFKEQNQHSFFFVILYLIVLILIILGNMVEFLMYFLITDSFTFLELPLEQASLIEFIIFTLLSSLLALFSIVFVRMKKFNAGIDRGICLFMILLNALKLIFYFPSITLDKEYLFFLLKQYVPLVTNSLTIFFSIMQIPEIKYQKYQ